VELLEEQREIHDLALAVSVKIVLVRMSLSAGAFGVVVHFPEARGVLGDA
jgi:hypothetical protein